MRLASARTPDGLRIYAIGDIHGCLTQLEDLYRQIDDDLAGAPAVNHRIVHLGDYLDRGPDSRGVVEHLSGMAERRSDVDFICGNHDVNFLEFLSNPALVPGRR